MKTAYELLLDAPDAQVKRCQLAWKAIAAGEWLDAAHFLRNAVKEEAGAQWAEQAAALADACQTRVNPQPGERVIVSGNEFEVVERESDPRRSTHDWYQCIQRTGHPAVVGTIQYLSRSMIATGDRAAPRIF
ncbi:hypothetical protein [Burkholderia sp. MSMB2041]|nr:hypothetical protein [Burkholderia sp. MSMB2041]